MDHHQFQGRDCSGYATPPASEEEDLRRGPWTVEEDLVLMNYITVHGEGRWNSLARSAGLRRTGKSCRLRWLNYLRPDVRRGNIAPEEQLLILELHSRWGNRWSKIAKHLPGRTDNEIKNYWRTRVQKHAKKLQCDVNSKQFKDIICNLWMPRLVERIRAASGYSPAATAAADTYESYVDAAPTASMQLAEIDGATASAEFSQLKPSPESSSFAASSSDSLDCLQLSSPPLSDQSLAGSNSSMQDEWAEETQFAGSWTENIPSPGSYSGLGLQDFDQNGRWGDNLWSLEDIWLQQQF